VNFTVPFGINSAGDVTGVHCEHFNCYGFVRNAQGSFTTFGVPGAACGTMALGINASGTVTGFWGDDQCNTHGFVRSRDGTITSFDVPGYIYTFTSDIINARGDVAGYYADNNTGILRGYLRTADGTLTLFDEPNACQANNGTFVAGIDDAGVIAGTYQDSANNCFTFYGFLRYPDGTYITVDPSQVGAAEVTAIAPNGTLAGAALGDFNSFLQSPSGALTTFSLPGGIVSYTNVAVNSTGMITGSYFEDSTFQYVAYVWSQH
jgi:hypothetical protein